MTRNLLCLPWALHGVRGVGTSYLTGKVLVKAVRRVVGFVAEVCSLYITVVRSVSLKGVLRRIEVALNNEAKVLFIFSLLQPSISDAISG